ncbi:B12-binding domain-containing radical SAM protein [Candidatus Omnitrophota bacterium]
MSAKRNKKIILIYAGISESGFDNPRGNEGSWINHGLCLISAVLKNEGFSIDLIDLRRLKGWGDFEEKVGKNDFDIAGITMMSVDYDYATRCIDIIKRIKPNAKIIVGGAHASITPQELALNEDIDCVLVGEGEISIIELIRKLGDDRHVDKIVYGKRPDLNSLPFADRNLFLLPEEPFVSFLKRPFVTIIAGRGCIYNCNYCQPAERTIFGETVRRRSVGHVIEELKYLDEKFRFNSMMIHDDCLTEDPEWILEFCKKYRKHGFRQAFVCQSRPDLICKNKDMVKDLRKAGLVLFIIGFESGSQRILNFLRKGCTVEQNLEAAEICHKFGIKIWANYMLGLPTETKKEQKATVDMIRKISPYHCSPAYYTPHPGSDLFEYCIGNNLSLIKNHIDYRRNSYEPKIKGVDYDYLKKLLLDSIVIGEDQGRVATKLKPVILGFLENFKRRTL